MSLKKILLVGVICLFPVVAILSYFYVDKHTALTSKANYQENSYTQLALIDDFLTLFFKRYTDDVTELAQSQDLLRVEHDFPNYVAQDSTGNWEEKELSTLAQKVVASWRELIEKDEFVDDVYVGFESGASYSIVASEIGSGFVGLARPWYITGKISKNRSTLGSAYMSISGETVVPVVYKVFDTHNNFVGVIGIDISLTTVTAHLSTLNFGETGYIILVDPYDKMLTNSRYKRNNFKFIRDLDNKEFKEFYYSDAVHANIMIRKTPYLVSKYHGETGYTIISAIQTSEIIKPQYNTISTTKIMMGIFVLFSLIATYFAIRFVLYGRD